MEVISQIEQAVKRIQRYRKNKCDYQKIREYVESNFHEQKWHVLSDLDATPAYKNEFIKRQEFVDELNDHFEDDGLVFSYYYDAKKGKNMIIAVLCNKPDDESMFVPYWNCMKDPQNIIKYCRYMLSSILEKIEKNADVQEDIHEGRPYVLNTTEIKNAMFDLNKRGGNVLKFIPRDETKCYDIEINW